MQFITQTSQWTHEEWMRSERRIQSERNFLLSLPQTIGLTTLLSPLPIVMRDDIDTAATDGKKLYYSPEFVALQDFMELRGLTLHEGAHVGDGHHLRRGNRDPVVFNQACDYKINGMIMRMVGYGVHFKLPKDGLFHEEYSSADCLLSVEQIYDRLIAEMPEPPEGGQGGPDPQGTPVEVEDEGEGECEGEGAGQGHGEGEGDREEEGEGAGEGEGDGEDGAEAQGQGEGEGEAEDEGDGQGQGQGSAPEGEREVPQGMGQGQSGEIWDAPEPEDGTTREQEIQDLMDRVREASILEKAQGNEGGSAVTEMTNAPDCSIKWDILEEILTGVISQQWDYNRPNRRFIWNDMYLPSMKKDKGTVHVCFDTSGSMGQSDLANGQGNVQGICRQLDISKLRLACVDSKLHMNPDADEPNSPWWDFDIANGSGDITFPAVGGGGTSFDPIFDHLAENGEDEDVQVLVYITDGYGSVSVPPPNYEVIWLLTEGLRNKPTFWSDKRYSKRVLLTSEAEGVFGTFIDIEGALDGVRY